MKDLKVFRICVTVLLAAVCFQATFAGGTKETSPATATAPKSELRGAEAPMLAALVKEGKLPPLKDRLPASPLVLPVVDRVGNYGGTLHGVSVGTAALRDTRQMIGIEEIFKFTPEGVTPNVIESYDFSADAKVLVMRFRKGMKWSDGQPFTADDLQFWYEDILLNKELTPVVSTDWKAGGEVLKSIRVDEYTLRWEFAAPNPQILNTLAHAQGTTIIVPKHYLMQFHPRYASAESIQNLIRATEGAKQWYQVFNQKRENVYGIPIAAGLPGITAYMFQARRPDGGYDLVRNPYFWKVDPQGNQLPYIDRVESQTVPTVELFNAKLLSGEIDVTMDYQTSLDNLALYKQGEQRGNYNITMWNTADSADIFVTLNQTVKNPDKRAVFQDKRFRQALSVGMDRDEINKVLFFGIGQPVQLSVLPDTPWFKPEYQTAYAKFSLAQANKLLDDMGLRWDARKEFRLTPGGQKLTITMEYLARAESWVKTAELLRDQWKKLGVDLILNQIEQALYEQRIKANDVEMTVWHADDNSAHRFIATHALYVPWFQIWHSTVAPAWATWNTTNGKEGEEPPAAIKDLFKQSEILRSTTDAKERLAAGRAILDYQAENLMSIGIMRIPKPVIRNNYLRNVPDRATIGWDYMGAAFLDPNQFYFDPPRNR